MRKRVCRPIESEKIFKSTKNVKCIITLKSGLHKIVFFTVNKLMVVFAAMNSKLKEPFLSERHYDVFRELGFLPDDFASSKFYDDHGREFLSLA